MKQRMITGLIGGSVFVLLIGVGGWFFYGLLLLLALIGFWEYARMNGLPWKHPASLIGFAGVLVLLIPWDKLEIHQPDGIHMLWLLMFLVLTITVLTKNKMTIDGAALMLLGALYVGYGFHAMFEVRNAETHGLLATFLAFGSDMGL